MTDTHIRICMQYVYIYIYIYIYIYTPPTPPPPTPPPTPTLHRRKLMATLDNGDDVTQLSGRAALRMHVRIHNHQPRVGESLKSQTLAYFGTRSL